MRKLSSLILLLVLSASLTAQKSPHGDSFRANCDDCHKTDGWKVDLKTISFDHDGTKFPLVGQHQAVSCKDCHASPEFAKAETECNACHMDIHEQTVGTECARCHTPNSWMVTNITQLHQQGRFPLVGPHTVAECKDCHINLLPSSYGTASRLRFDPLGVECYDCHSDNYAHTTKPNHVQGNYSKNCTDCHSMNSFSWSGAGINHDFFPLSGGHSNVDCSSCHTSGSFSKIPAECDACHLPDYAAASNPNHASLSFPTNCIDCHTLDPGWKPADYKNHDTQSFPIYSGKHKGEWNNCSDCHKNAGNYSLFTCIDCHDHNQPEMDSKHNDVSGYAYNSIACFGCHPTGSGEGSFDHNAAGFPLTAGHASVDCSKCHTNGFSGTSPVCAGCHTTNYNQSTNPDHTGLGISTDCAACHTTNSDWQPAAFATHDTYYKLEGAHLPIANDCATCHNGNYVNSPNICFGCHTDDYTQSNNPSHSAAQFPTTCADCHSQSAWAPATFNHDGEYFPIYSGKHKGEWTNCNECHTTASNYALYSCIDCHEHNQASMNNKHQGVGGYVYNSIACFNCHPTGSAEGSFDHNTSGFPLTGGHAISDCVSCHASGYVNTSNVCSSCHINNYNQTTNPNHTALSISNDCAACHTTNPGWNPATFATHNNYYVLAGAHVGIANDCATCHQGNYVNPANTCFGCHASDYNQTTNPNHTASQFATTCETCHSQTAWVPSTFNHNNIYPLIGAHAAIAGNCNLCHSNGYTNTPNTCAGCHMNDYNQTTNPNHAAAQFPTTCEDCHSQNAWNPSTFDHDGQYFPIYSGKHEGEWNSCSDCHPNPTNYAVFTCTTSCHPQASTNNKHQGVSGYSYNSAACLNCHPNGSGDKMKDNSMFRIN